MLGRRPAEHPRPGEAVVGGECEVRHLDRACLTDPQPRVGSLALSPARSNVPMCTMAGIAPSSLIAVIVAIAAAMGQAWNQNDPVTKMREAASLKLADPRTAASGYPLPIALLHALRSGATPIGSQLPPSFSRKPARTSSITSAAPIRSHRARNSRANSGSTSSWSKPASCLKGDTMIAATSPPASATAFSTLVMSLYT